jgi:hypothetical protein
MADRLPGLLVTLQESVAYGRGPGRKKPSHAHGVYLFTEGDRHMYVGRTGRTERSIQSGKPSASGFRKRLAGHSTPGAELNTASFALRLAMEDAANEGLEVPAARKDRLEVPRFVELFSAAKERITAMEFRTVDIDDDRESYVFELYAAFVLDTPYNSFATS